MSTRAIGNGTDDMLHWMLWNIPARDDRLPERVPRGVAAADGTRQISATGPNYRGPGAPAAGPAHHYVFELFALDTMLDVPAVGASPPNDARGGRRRDGRAHPRQSVIHRPLQAPIGRLKEMVARTPTAQRVRRRVVVTGIGLVSPVGIGTEITWRALLAGQSGIGPITLFDAERYSTRFAGEVSHFDPLQWIDKKDVKKCGRFIQFAIAATTMAMEQSGLRIGAENADRVGVFIGSGIGGFEVIEREHRILLERGPERVSPFFILSAIVNLAAGQVSVRLGAKGPNSAVATACTTGAHAIGDAFRLVRDGYADAMICGGTEASITPLGVAGFAAMRALSTRNDDPVTASRPWDQDRDGFVVGEGAGILVLEAADEAARRGATPLAELVGYGMSADAHHLTAPPPDGDGVARAMQAALDDAELMAGDVRVHQRARDIDAAR